LTEETVLQINNELISNCRDTANLLFIKTGLYIEPSLLLFFNNPLLDFGEIKISIKYQSKDTSLDMRPIYIVICMLTFIILVLVFVVWYKSRLRTGPTSPEEISQLN
jgi:hypothetical protein